MNISVFPLDIEQNVTRYSTDWQELPSPPITLTMTVSGQTVTIGGTPGCPLNTAVLVNNTPFVYPLQATDTPTSIATALAALISVDTRQQQRPGHHRPGSDNSDRPASVPSERSSRK